MSKDKINFIIGFFIGIIAAFLACFLFLQFFTKAGFSNSLIIIRQAGYIGKVITLSAIINLIIFFYLLKINKDFMAKGIILAMFIITIITIIL